MQMNPRKGEIFTCGGILWRVVSVSPKRFTAIQVRGTQFSIRTFRKSDGLMIGEQGSGREYASNMREDVLAAARESACTRYMKKMGGLERLQNLCGRIANGRAMAPVEVLSLTDLRAIRRGIRMIEKAARIYGLQLW